MKYCLVIDDSEVIRKVALQLIKDLALEGRDADNGQDALALCAENMPDVILLDWHMPLLTGNEFLVSLRSQPNGHKPVIFYCTTENDPLDIARALAAGADDYILKPYDRESIKLKFQEAGLV